MEPRDLVVVGGSAGSFAPLLELAKALPASLPAAVAVTTHTGEQAPVRMPRLLSEAGKLPARSGATGDPLAAGSIYVAPPGHHMLLTQGVVELSTGPRMNRSRPSIDAMFASAARWYGDRVVAVVLSGTLDDGAVGAALIAQAGGLVVVQDPADARYPSMPAAALAATPGAIAVRGEEIGAAVTGMLGEAGLAGWPAQPRQAAAEPGMNDTGDLQFLAADEMRLTRLACPECGGALAEAELARISYYRCHVGHQFAPQSLAAAQADSAEAKLWSAVAALEETAALSRHLAGHQNAADAGRARATAAWAAELADSVRSRIRQDDQDATGQAGG